ncbi:MAG: conjugal transfer protein TrbD [Azoarcus sp.]|jgi:type IV secretion system protein VirB3|nr:conjugal transfer protein TrbD [Azoarcus sp.]
MALRSVPIHRAGNRAVLFMGGDREWVMMSGVLSASLIFTAFTWYALIYGLALWFFALCVLRIMAKSDPRLIKVYARSLRYHGAAVADPATGKPISGYFPPRSTPWRENTPFQVGGYK